MSNEITIIGTGYVGLVSGACFADVGNDCRNLYDPTLVRDLGFEYLAIGR